jgi:uncharacterized protein
MNLLDLSGGTEIIGYEECRELLSSERVGRLGTVIDGRQEIFPVNYGLDGDGILFRSNQGHKLTGALLGEVVFEVDRIDVEARSGWSVVVRGVAHDISRFDGPALKAQAEEPWTGPKDALVRISLESVTGRRVTPPSP